jgi:Flp pilus assembly protein CpaB
LRASRETLISLLVALAAGGLAWLVIGQITKTTSVVIVAKDVEPLTRLDAGLVKLAAVPVSAAHPKGLKRIDDAVGKRTIGPLTAGQQLLSTQLTDPGQGVKGWYPGSSVIMFVPMPQARWAGGIVQAGDIVDLVFCTNEQRTGVSLAKVILTGVPVVGQIGAGPRKWDSAAPDTAGLNLVLSTQDAERIAFCLENGTLYACLSGKAGDRTGTGASLQTVLGLPGGLQPARVGR